MPEFTRVVELTFTPMGSRSDPFGDYLPHDITHKLCGVQFVGSASTNIADATETINCQRSDSDVNVYTCQLGSEDLNTYFIRVYTLESLYVCSLVDTIQYSSATPIFAFPNRQPPYGTYSFDLLSPRGIDPASANNNANTKNVELQSHDSKLLTHTADHIDLGNFGWVASSKFLVTPVRTRPFNSFRFDVQFLAHPTFWKTTDSLDEVYTCNPQCNWIFKLCEVALHSTWDERDPDLVTHECVHVSGLTYDCTFYNDLTTSDSTIYVFVHAVLQEDECGNENFDQRYVRLPLVIEWPITCDV